MLVSALLPALLATPQSDPAVTAARTWRRDHEHAIVSEFVEFLALPNGARDLPRIRANADWIEGALRRRGLDPRRLVVPYAPPVVYAELVTPGAERTIVLYAHYDGQPVDPTQWAGEPFQPALRDGTVEDGGQLVPFPEPGTPFDPAHRLYGRSTSDDKAAVIGILAALDALRAADVPLRANVKLFFEGEEELGSHHLEAILEKYRDTLAADLWIFCDGPLHASRRQQVVFGVRGVTGLDLTMYGARRPLHSGHYGNWSPNPALQLARLLTTMKDEEGNVTVAGYLDDVTPLSDAERAALAAVPDVDDALRDELWLAASEGHGSLAERLCLPSLNVRGLSAANVGPAARNIVPSVARASIDTRLVPGMDPDRTLDRIVEHIRGRGYHVVEEEPDAATRRAHPRVVRVQRRKGYRAMRTPLDSPLARSVVAAVRRARPDTIRVPTLGGSLPLALFEDVLDTPVVIVPIANHDNNQHAENENIRLQNLWDGIEVYACLLTL